MAHVAPFPGDDPSAELLRRWQDDGDPEALNRLLQIEVGVLKQMIHGRAPWGCLSQRRVRSFVGARVW
jgi:hypothetical protein